MLKKCIDPQRTTAPSRDTVSNNGYNPALTDLRRGIAKDLSTLDNTRQAADKATHATLDENGEPVTEIADKAAYDALSSIISDALSDGIDLVQEAAALLEQAAKHANGVEWLDRPYTFRDLDKRVYIQLDDSAAYKDVDTTPIQEVYRAVRKAVQDSRAIQTDPRNGYTYIEDYAENGEGNGLEVIYRRLQKWSDMGGYAQNGQAGTNMPGSPSGIGRDGDLYTADIETARRVDEIIKALELTDRQKLIFNLRMRGMGYRGNKAIATYLGVSDKSIKKTVSQIKKKAVKIGLTDKN